MSSQWALAFHSTTDRELIIWPQFKTWYTEPLLQVLWCVGSGVRWPVVRSAPCQKWVYGLGSGISQVFLKFHLSLYTTWIGVVPLSLRLSGGFHEARERDWCIMSLQNLVALIREGWTFPRTDYRLKAEVLKGVVFRWAWFFVFCFCAKVTWILSFTFISKAFSRWRIYIWKKRNNISCKCQYGKWSS